jgi:hypothetical protein
MEAEGERGERGEREREVGLTFFLFFVLCVRTDLFFLRKVSLT